MAKLVEATEKDSKRVRQSPEEFQSAPNIKSEDVKPKDYDQPNALGREVVVEVDGIRKSDDVEKDEKVLLQSIEKLARITSFTCIRQTHF